MSAWLRSHLAETFLGVAAILGLASSVQQLVGIDGNGLLGAGILVVIIAAVVIYVRLKHLRRGVLRQISLHRALREYAPDTLVIDGIFSAADQLRQALEAGAFDHLNGLRAGLTLRIITRERTGPDSTSVRERIERLTAKASKLGVQMEHREFDWDHFMVGGLLFDRRIAIVKFYYRRNGTTHTLSDEYLLVRKGYGLEDQYFVALEAAFESLWP